MIIPLSAQTPATSGAAGASAAVSAASQLDQEAFLTLMVAQLRNQDPMNPTDSSEFLAQTAQFTSLEKLQQVADQSTQAFAAQMAFGASSLVGRTVTYTGTDGVEVSGTVSSVRFGPAGPLLEVDGNDVSLDQLAGVQT